MLPRDPLCLTTLPLVLLTSLAACRPAVVFNAGGLNWEERCSLEALQGLANRSGPLLYLDFGNSWDRKWLDIYRERNGLQVEYLDSLPEVFRRFAPDAGGLVAYDPDVDGSRYVAITLAGVEDLIPVAPEVLEGLSPGFTGPEPWPGLDFSGATDVDLRNLRPAADPRLSIVPGRGLRMVEGNPREDWSFASYGPLSVDISQYPFLEVEVASVRGAGAGWQIKLTWDRDGDGVISGGEDDLCLPVQHEPGVQRWNVAELAGISGPQRFSHIQFHVIGPKARVLWRRVRFVSAQGQSPAAAPPVPLSQYGLELREDLRGRFADSLHAYDWALRELMPRCNRRFAHAVNGRVEGILAGCGPFAGFDWPVRQRGFVFNLACPPDEAQSYGASRVGGSPEQAAMYERIVEALEAPAQITGYGEPEDYWCSLVSNSGHYSFHFGDNWSFHCGIPAEKPLQQQRSRYAGGKLDPDKFYVCFMTSEGDTMKGPMPFFYGSWFEEERGQVANNWGINPLMATQFPAMVEYFYDTATENDYFFVGCSGAGYVYPDVMPNLEQFAEHTRAAAELADTDCIDMWGASRREVVERYANITRPTGLSINAGPARLAMLPGRVPVAYHELAYWQVPAAGQESWTRAFRDDAARAKAIDWVVNRIESIADRHYPPFIILVYGDLHSWPHHCRTHAEIAAALDPERFACVRLDDAMASIRAWSQDRVMIGAESLNERLAWAVMQGVPTTVPLCLTNGREQAADVQVGVRAGDVEVSRRVSIPAGATREMEGLSLKLDTRPAGETTLTLRAPGQDETRPVDLTVVPVADPPAAARAAAVWSAANLRHAAGEPLADAEVVGGQAWLSPEPGEPSCHILFGPYADMPPGRTIVAFRLRLDATQEQVAALDADEVLATLDLSAGGYKGTGESCAVAHLRVADFRTPGRWEWCTIEGDWPGDPSQMETRVWWTSKARIALDRVAVFRVG